MGIIEFLKKIGVLKTWNASGSYKNAKERPDKFTEKDLYDGTDPQLSDTNDQGRGADD